MSTKKPKRRPATDMREHSRLVVDGLKQTGARAMLRAVGFSDADFGKPQVGVASTWANLTPCNMHHGLPGYALLARVTRDHCRFD
jgi:dihydroxy-acid dehydratase